MLFCRGLYITILDAGHVLDVLCNWPQKDIKVRLIDVQYMQCIDWLGVQVDNMCSVTGECMQDKEGRL